jgi:hypothetical protein
MVGELIIGKDVEEAVGTIRPAEHGNDYGLQTMV